METKQLKRIAKVTEEQYQEVMNNGSIVIGGVVKHKDDYEFVTNDTTLEQAKEYTDEQITKAIAGGGGTKLYRHHIVCYIENTNSGSMLEINDAIITTKSEAYTDINEAIADYIKAGGRMVQCYNGIWLLLYNGWEPVYDGGTISTERYYDLIQTCAFSQVELNLPDEISTMSVYFQDTKVEEL